MNTANSTSQTVGSRKNPILWIFLICLIAAIALAATLVLLYLSPTKPGIVRTPQALNGPSSLLPTSEATQVLVSHLQETSSHYDPTNGEVFHYALGEQDVSDEIFYEPLAIQLLYADGYISSTAYYDTELQLLYLDYGVEKAGCFTYLTLDAAQTQESATPLTGLIPAGAAIDRISYTFEALPEYITVMGLVVVDEQYHYFAPLCRQKLNITSGTTKELLEMGIGDISLLDPMDAPFVALDGIWITAAQPVIADDDEHSYFSDGGYYVFAPNGSFTFQPLKLGKQGVWYHMGGGEGTYEGTYHYTGSVLILNYSIYNEPYFDESLGYEQTRPVEYHDTEQFTLEINQSCASMCAVIPDHPRFGQTLIFERSKSDDPVHALLVAINSLP